MRPVRCLNRKQKCNGIFISFRIGIRFAVGRIVPNNPNSDLLVIIKSADIKSDIYRSKERLVRIKLRSQGKLKHFGLTPFRIIRGAWKRTDDLLRLHYRFEPRLFWKSGERE